MRQKLFTIDDNFNIAGRGIVVTGELEPNSPSCRIGSIVVLIHPNGNELVTEINGIEQIKLTNIENFNRNKIGVMFKDVTKKDVPVGTIVLLDTSK